MPEDDRLARVFRHLTFLWGAAEASVSDAVDESRPEVCHRRYSCSLPDPPWVRFVVPKRTPVEQFTETVEPIYRQIRKPCEQD